MAFRSPTSFPTLTVLAGIFLIIVFLTGGGSRPDITSLTILRPVAAAALILFAVQLNASDWSTLRAPLSLAAMAILLTVVQLIPLPPGLWSSLPGRELLREAAALTGLGNDWRSLSVVPWRTVNAVFSWLVPLAAAFAMTAGNSAHRLRLLVVIVVLGLASGFLSILQVLGPPEGPLYFYSVTNTGQAVGLFSNRNHQALLLASLLPLLAAYACTGVTSVEQHRRRSWVAIAAAAALVPLILVNGSRAGILLFLIGAASMPFVYKAPNINQPAKRSPRAYYPVRIGIGIGFIGLAATALVLSRATSIQRLVESGQELERRPEVWARTWGLIADYFPFGAGFGTFIETYHIDEPREKLVSTIANHAHNDWLEAALGGGIVAIVLLLAAVALWMIATWRLVRDRSEASTSAVLGRAGSSIVLMAGLGSIADYPLRTPSIAALFAIAVVWMAVAISRARGNDLALQR